MIYPSGSAASILSEFSQQLQDVLDIVQVQPVPVNMASAEALAKAIRDARCDLLAIVRGGGDSLEFAVFEYPSVVSELAAKPVYRVTGIGHADTKTPLDLICECSVDTPTAAGAYIRNAVFRYRQEAAQAVQLAAKLRKTQRYLQWLTVACTVLLVLALGFLLLHFYRR